jgi:hypothetical protein
MTLFGGGIVALRELGLYSDWTTKNLELYHAAEQAAKKNGKPLLVVGRPILKNHGCGDVCIDLVGCPECPPGVGVKGDIRDMHMFKNRQFGAAYVGEVVECIDADGMKKAIDELYRVADEVYIAHLPDYSLTAQFFPGVHSIIHSAPPQTPYKIDFTDLATGKRQTVEPRSLGGLGALETDTRSTTYLVVGGGLAIAAGLVWFLWATRE